MHASVVIASAHSLYVDVAARLLHGSLVETSVHYKMGEGLPKPAVLGWLWNVA